MSDQQLRCAKCSSNFTTLYRCCSPEKLICYRCVKYQTCDCGKKINTPFTLSKIRGISQKPTNEDTCNICRKTIEKTTAMQFQCKHMICFKCIGRRVQESIKNNTWQVMYNKDPTKKQLKCNCGSGHNLDISSWLQKNCFYCGQSFPSKDRFYLKYGLVLMQSCRNKIFYEHQIQSILNYDHLMKLQKQCKSCTELIDGNKKKAGFEDNQIFECQQCWQGINHKSRQLKKQEPQNCLLCSISSYKSSMIKVDNFFLCLPCHNNSKEIESKKQSKEIKKEEKDMMFFKKKQNNMIQEVEEKPKKSNIKRQTVLCLICGHPIFNPEQNQSTCLTCLQIHRDSPLVKELSISTNKQPSKLSSRIEKSPAKRMYRSKEEHNTFRKKVNYRAFLKEEGEELHVSNPPIIQEAGKLMIENKIGRKSNYTVLDTIIQEIPDMDSIRVAISKNSLSYCELCGYIMETSSLITHKNTVNVCLHCYMVRKAKYQ